MQTKVSLSSYSHSPGLTAVVHTIGFQSAG